MTVGRRRKTQPLSKHVPIRFTPEVIAGVKQFADADRRTVSSWIRHLVEDEVKRRSDWADDDSMSAEETMARFEALGPDLTVGPNDDLAEINTTPEEFDTMFAEGEPAVLVDPDPSRERLIRVVAETIWQHGFKTSGTATSSLDVGPGSLAAAIVDRFTCTECGFLDMFEGNDHGECNDCAPRVSRRKPRCGSRYDSPREDDDCYCVCAKAVGHSGRHLCSCSERWTDDQASRVQPRTEEKPTDG